MPTTLRVLDPERTRGIGPAITFSAVMAVLMAAHVLLAPDPLAQDLLYDGIGIVAVLAVIAGVVHNRPERRGPWILIALGLLCFVVGDVLWSVLSILGEEPFPSVADIAYLAGYPMLVVAFGYVIAIRVADGDRSGMLDAAILAVAVALVGWIMLLWPVLDAPGDALSLAIGVAYPLGDLVVIPVAIAMLATPGARGMSFTLLVGALVSLFVGDTIYAFQVAGDGFEEGGLLDLTWLATYAMMGTAALLPSMRVVAVPRPVGIAWLSATRLGFVTLAMLTGPALVLVHQDRDVLLLAAGSAVLSLMVVWRLAVVVRALSSDNAARRSLEDELSYRATHDPLTGLSNRRRFLEQLDEALTGPHDAVSVLFLDLDDFKGINDTLGHATGDELLVTVARRIRAHLRDGDIAARMGGDEFGILVRTDEAVAVRVAQRLLIGLDAPVSVGGHTVVARGSIGVAQARPGVTVADLLGDADIAMYKAKAMGKGTVCAFAPGLRDDVVDRMELEADLRAALRDDGLTLAYQPIVDLAAGTAVGVEALVRWNHPERGALAPSAFIPLAEATGLGGALGSWVLETACRQVAAWRADRQPDLCLAVNLAPRQLAGTDLVAVVWNAARSAGLPIRALIVDVTEGALLLEAPEVAANLAALRALGARVAIDDFGTGYSSLGHLGRLPVDILKIDPAFVARLDSEDDRGIAAIVVSLGKTLGLETIAEGIERPEQLAAVRRLGCRLGQGFLLAPPASAADLEASFLPHAEAGRVAGTEARTSRPRFPFASGA